MKWISLKIKNLPIISLEIQRAIQVFEGMVKRVKITKKDEILEVIELRNALNQRALDLQHFYEQHHLQDSISMFHMLKIKLERILFNNRDYLDQANNKSISLKQDSNYSYEQNQLKILDQPLFTYFQSSVKKSNHQNKQKHFIKDKTLNSHNNIDQNNSYSNQLHPIKKNLGQSFNKNVTMKAEQNKIQSKVNSTKLVNKDTGPQFQIYSPLKKKSGNNQKKQTKNNGEPVKKMYSTAVFKPKEPLAISKIHKRKQTQTPSFVEQDSDMNKLESMGNVSELKFTIRMTKQEYKQLLQMKKKMQIDDKK